MSKIRILKKNSALPPLFYGFYGPTISELTDLGACHWPILMEDPVQTREFQYIILKNRADSLDRMLIH